ncbi:MAG: EamA family transporter [Solirubrobacteraceae bacterium]|nr:EamA family transporter [Solirubrobacteraceae bacterium]
MIELGLAACASVAWGASDFAAGVAARRRSVLVVLAASQCTGLVLAMLALALAGASAPSGPALLSAALAGAFEAIGFGALYAALARGPMGVVAPAAALGGVIPLASGVIGGERLGMLAATGCIAALVAVVLVSREPADGRTQPGLAPGLSLALLSAAAFGLFFLFLDLAADEAPFIWGVAIARATAVVLVVPVLTWHVVRRRSRGSALAVSPGSSERPRAGGESGSSWVAAREVGALAVVGVLDIAANLLFAWGASRADGPLVGVVGSTYPVFTVLLAAGLLGERLALTQRAGVVLALAASALIVL